MPVELRTLGLVIANTVEPYLDAQPAVITRALLDPPPDAATGDRYLIPFGATGEWSLHENTITEWTGFEWTYVTAARGMSVWIEDENVEAFFDGGVWGPPTPPERAVLTPLNKRMPARPTLADGDRACDIAMARTPVPGSRVYVEVNGVRIPELGDGTKANAACYFSADGGYSARALNAIVAGDVLYWNGSIAGYQIDATDVIEFVYEVA